MNGPKTAPVRRRLLSDDVVEYLSKAIFRGDFKPGEKVVETKIARLLNVSQGSVREAFQVLKVMGFLESVPFRGNFVRQFTHEGLKDYFRTRHEIEMIAVRWSAERGEDPQNMAYLRKCVSLIKNYNKKDRGRTEAREADLDFHRAIVASARSESLLAAWEALNHSFWFSYGIHLEEDQYMVIDRQGELHKRLLDLFEAKKIEEFEKLLAEHFINPKSILRNK